MTHLRVHVLAGQGLPVGDLLSSDPFVQISVVGPDGTRLALQMTRAVPNSVHPDFNEVFDFIDDRLSSAWHVQFSVIDHDADGSHDALGETAPMPLDHLRNGDVVQVWLPLSPKGGQLMIKLEGKRGFAKAKDDELNETRAAAFNTALQAESDRIERERQAVTAEREALLKEREAVNAEKERASVELENAEAAEARRQSADAEHRQMVESETRKLRQEQQQLDARVSALAAAELRLAEARTQSVAASDSRRRADAEADAKRDAEFAAKASKLAEQERAAMARQHAAETERRQLEADRADLAARQIENEARDQRLRADAEADAKRDAEFADKAANLAEQERVAVAREQAADSEREALRNETTELNAKRAAFQQARTQAANDSKRRVEVAAADDNAVAARLTDLHQQHELEQRRAEEIRRDERAEQQLALRSSIDRKKARRRRLEDERTGGRYSQFEDCLETTFSAPLIAKVCDMFIRHDRDTSNSISADELQTVLQDIYFVTGTPVPCDDVVRKNVRQLLAAHDQDKGGALGVAEFCNMLVKSDLAASLRGKYKP